MVLRNLSTKDIVMNSNQLILLYVYYKEEDWNEILDKILYN